MTGWIWSIVALGAGVAACPSMLASNPEPGLWRYAHRDWTPENSALRSGVRAIAQTPDGYLWLGVDSGLIRFDGLRMVPWMPAPGQQLPGTPVHLAAARDGTLWIGTTGGLASLKNGRLNQYPALSGFFISNLLAGRDGDVWAAGAWGNQSRKVRVCALRNGSATCYGDDGAFGDGVSSIFEDAGGELWIATGTALWHWKPGPPTRYDVGTTVPALKQDESGSGFTFLSGGKVRQISGGRITDYPLPAVPFPLNTGSLVHDRHGALWIGTSRGLLYTYQGTTRLITHSDGLSSDPVSEMFEDREGTIWIGTSDGLDSFRELPFASLSLAEGLSSSSIRGVLAARDGSIWIGTATGLDRWKDGHMSIYRPRTNPGWSGDDMGTLFEDERSRIWVQAYPGVAVFESGRFRAVPSVPSGTITAIASDHHGGLWLQLMQNPNDYGLVHWVDGKVIDKVRWNDLGGGPGAGLVVDPDGGVWTALFSGDIAYFHAGKIRNLQLSGENAGSRRVFNLSRERDGALWAATEHGLSRIANGHVSTLTTANGLPCNVVHWLMEDGGSSYWLYTACGLLRIARSELDAWTADPKRKIQSTIFDSADGIPLRGMLLPWRPHVTKSPDGRIWFGNVNSVSVIDPSHIGVNTLSPPVHIEQITADGKTYKATSGLRLPPLVRTLVIDYTALSLAAPERVRFRYNLEGQDSDWSEITTDRKVQYSNLAPRNYRFRVIACNNSGIWNDKGDVLDFIVAPAYYQTGWFRALLAGVLLVVLGALYRYRLHRLAHEFNVRLEERVDERTRIARELHDTLLQSFQGVLLTFRSAAFLLPDRPAEARNTLEDGIEQARAAIIEGRDAVEGLRSSSAVEEDIGRAISKSGRRLAGEICDNPPGFQVYEQGAPRSLAPGVAGEVDRIAGEALRNAFHHAAADRIEAEICYDKRQFRLRIRDNGKGIDRDILGQGGRPGHHGLPGMHERARLIGAKLAIWSEPGSGTEVELQVPAALAYAGRPGSRQPASHAQGIEKGKR